MHRKGLTKAVSRLPHLVLQKTGVAEETLDEEFAPLSLQFEKTCTSTVRLADDLKKYGQAVTNMLEHQIAILGVWRKVVGEETHHDDLELMDKTLEALQKNKTKILDELNATLKGQSVKILDELLSIQKTINSKITKRSHKLLDFDRHGHSVKKLEVDNSRSLRDERKLMKNERALTEAKVEYNKYNDQLKEDLPIYFSLHEQLMMPVLHSVIAFQQTLYQGNAEALFHIQKLGKCDYSAVLKVHEEESIEALAFINENPMIQLLVGGKRLDRDKADKINRNSTQCPFSPKDVPINPIEVPKSNKFSSSPKKENLVSNSKNPVDEEKGELHSRTNSEQRRPGKVSELAARLNNLSVSRPAALPTKPSSSFTRPKKLYAVAIYDFPGQEQGDLSFCVGDRIEVVKRSPEINDWWTGILHGKTGLFPGNYVRLENSS